MRRRLEDQLSVEIGEELRIGLAARVDVLDEVAPGGRTVARPEFLSRRSPDTVSGDEEQQVLHGRQRPDPGLLAATFRRQDHVDRAFGGAVALREPPRIRATDEEALAPERHQVKSRVGRAAGRARSGTVGDVEVESLLPVRLLREEEAIADGREPPGAGP